MSKRRPVARRSYARRRIRRITSKWNYVVIPRRFKLLMPLAAPELAWELEVLDYLETTIFPILQAQGVPEALWEYYMGYAKRLWERALNFTQLTYTNERTSLRNEYVLRGLQASILDLFDQAVLDAAKLKIEKALPIPKPGWGYDNVVGTIWLADPAGSWGGYYDNELMAIHLQDPSLNQGGYYDNRL